MPKSAIEKAIEKQMKQDKQLAAKRKREEDKRARESREAARKVAIREQAMTIVNGQPIINGLRIMDDASEEVFKMILSVYEPNDERFVSGNYEIIPVAYHDSLSVEFEKLRLYGVISSPCVWINAMWEATITPQGITYFENKEQALKRHEEEQKQMSVGNITNYGNIVFGNVSNSTLSVDNSIHKIERMIDENGGEDAEELRDLLNEVKELIENMQASRSIPKQKKLFQRLNDHVVRHGWFYGAVVQLLGTAAMTMLSTQ